MYDKGSELIYTFIQFSKDYPLGVEWAHALQWDYIC